MTANPGFMAASDYKIDKVRNRILWLLGPNSNCYVFTLDGTQPCAALEKAQQGGEPLRMKTNGRTHYEAITLLLAELAQSILETPGAGLHSLRKMG